MPDDEGRKFLMEKIKPVIKKIMKDMGFKDLKVHFHKPPARSFLRSWKINEKLNGENKLHPLRHTIEYVSRNHKPIKVIEEGRSGLFIRGIAPIFGNNGEYLGAVEVLFDFKHLIGELSVNEKEAVAFMMKSTGKIQKTPYTIKFSGGEVDKMIDIVGKEEFFKFLNKTSLFAIKKNVVIHKIPIVDFNGVQKAILVFFNDFPGYSKVLALKIMKIGFIGFLFFLFVIIGVNLLMREMMKRMTTLLHFTKKYEEGDFGVRLTDDVDDEIGEISRGINGIIDSIKPILGDLKANSNQLLEDSVKLNHAIDSVSLASKEQENKVNLVASAMEELTASFLGIKTSVDEAYSLANESSEKTNEAKEAVDKTISAIERISQKTEDLSSIISQLEGSTEKIGEITTVIEEIADQTNLLALNAAIEAARAGEHKRGFAVVADEVRKLAERTGKATKEINEIISSLQEEAKRAGSSMKEALEEVEVGRELGRNSIDSMDRVKRSSEDIVNQTMSINSAISQIDKTIQEINSNILQIAEISSTTTNMISELVSVVDNLKRMSEKMKTSTDVFKV